MIPATVLLRPLRRQPASVRPGLRYLSVCAGIEAVSVAVRGMPASDCPDGPRYKALGNSMAVPVIRWICERIERFRA